MKYLGEFLQNQPCTWLESAKASQKDNVQQLESIAEEITENYNSYNDLIISYNNELPESSFLEYSKLLIEYYENAPSRLNKLLLKRRNEHELSFCPYCGNPVTPDTLDHFIPKRKWPEFSIFSNNLVPQCRECAPIKGENYYCNENHSAMFIHPFYFNFLENFRFSLNILFNAEDNEISITVRLRKTIETDDDDKKRVIFHAERLKIKSRIINYCKKDFMQWKRRLLKTKFDFNLALNQRLSEVPQSEIGKDWKSAFYYVLLQNQEIIDYMNSLCPEENSDQLNNDEEEFDF